MTPIEVNSKCEAYEDTDTHLFLSKTPSEEFPLLDSKKSYDMLNLNAKLQQTEHT